MKLGIFDGNSGPHVTVDDYVATARAAADAGFDSYWLPQIFGMEALSLSGRSGVRYPVSTSERPWCRPIPGIR